MLRLIKYANVHHVPTYMACYPSRRCKSLLTAAVGDSKKINGNRLMNINRLPAVQASFRSFSSVSSTASPPVVDTLPKSASASAPTLNNSGNASMKIEDISTRPKKKRRDPSTSMSDSNLRAFYVAKKINIAKLVQSLYPDHKLFHENDSVIVSLSNDQQPPINGDKYAIFYDYGAIVFLNCDALTQEQCLSKIAPFCQGKLSKPETEDFQIVVDPLLDDWSAFRANHIMLQSLDMNNIRVAASVIGQAAALSHFEQKVDDLLDEFDKYNEAAAKQSNALVSGISSMTPKPLHVFQILGEANNVLSSVILRLAILNRTKMRDTAWKYEKYHRVSGLFLALVDVVIDIFL